MKSLILIPLLVAASTLCPVLDAKPAGASTVGPAAPHPAVEERRPDVPAKPIKQVSPKYPRELRNRGVPGRVLLRFVVDTKGRVQDAEVVKSSDAAFDRPALEAIRAWRFSPAIQDGKPVKTMVQVPLEFSSRPFA